MARDAPLDGAPRDVRPGPEEPVLPGYLMRPTVTRPARLRASEVTPPRSPTPRSDGATALPGRDAQPRPPPSRTRSRRRIPRRGDLGGVVLPLARRRAGGGALGRVDDLAVHRLLPPQDASSLGGGAVERSISAISALPAAERAVVIARLPAGHWLDVPARRGGGRPGTPDRARAARAAAPERGPAPRREIGRGRAGLTGAAGPPVSSPVAGEESRHVMAPRSRSARSADPCPAPLSCAPQPVTRRAGSD